MDTSKANAKVYRLSISIASKNLGLKTSKKDAKNKPNTGTTVDNLDIDKANIKKINKLDINIAIKDSNIENNLFQSLIEK